MSQPEQFEHVLGCDLDGTYITVNSFPRFTVFAIRHFLRTGHLRSALQIVLSLAQRRLFGLSHTELKARVHAATAGIDTGLVNSWAADLLARYTNERVREAVQQWPGTTILATAAPAVYAKPLAELAHFDHCLSSELSVAGYLDNMSEIKAARLAMVTGPRIACAMTDEADVDLALLRMAESAYLVDGAGKLEPWLSRSGAA
jgi:phosphoserine phosphatase